jgi:hypothetical protein
MDHFQQDLVRFEINIVESQKIHQEVQTKAAVTMKDVERLEKKLEEVLSRRWEFWKIILGALIESIFTLGVQEVSKQFQRTAPIEKLLDKK